MAAPILFTDTGAVRACLGMTELECPDRVMVDSQLELELTVDLLEWLPTYQAIFDAGEATAATAEEKLASSYLILYSQWYCAANVASRKTLLIAELTNGKDKVSRFSKIDLDSIATDAMVRAVRYRAALGALVLGTVSVAGYSLISASVPDLDPITGIPD